MCCQLSGICENKQVGVCVQLFVALCTVVLAAVCELLAHCCSQEQWRCESVSGSVYDLLTVVLWAWSAGEAVLSSVAARVLDETHFQSVGTQCNLRVHEHPAYMTSGCLVAGRQISCGCLTVGSVCALLTLGLPG